MTVAGAEAQIPDGLLWWVSQLVTTPTTAFAMPNAEYTPVLGAPYLQVTVIPNMADATGIEFGSDIDHAGLMQISVFWPPNQGEIKPKQVAAQVVAWFARGTRIERSGLDIRIEDQPTIRPALSEPAWFQVPVIIRWRCIAPDPST